MLPMSAERMAFGCGGRLLSPGRSREFRRLSTDTRKLEPGDAFLALQGPNFNGERFFAAAQKKGAAALIGRRPASAKASAGRPALIQVSDGLAALQRLAADQRRLIQGPVIAITGSNGKTSAKECLAHLLGGPEEVLATPGNFNNHVGLPLALLGLEPGQKAAVLELGMNHAGEIARLAGICRPSVGVVLNVGDAHLGHFGSRRAIAAAKEELLSAMGPSGTAVINADDPLVAAMGARFRGRVFSYGTRAGAALRAEGVRDRGARGLDAGLRWQGRSFSLRLGLGGRARLYQALAGLAGGLAAGGELPAMLGRLASLKPQAKGRQQLERLGGLRLILDTYNASPQSMLAGLELLRLSAPRGARKLAVLGDMLELGAASPRLHLELGRAARKAGVDALAALGPQASRTAAGFGGGAVFGREQADQAARWLREEAGPGDWVLLKGSRGMAVERVYESLKGKR